MRCPERSDTPQARDCDGPSMFFFFPVSLSFFCLVLLLLFIFTSLSFYTSPPNLIAHSKKPRVACSLSCVCVYVKKKKRPVWRKKKCAHQWVLFLCASLSLSSSFSGSCICCMYADGHTLNDGACMQHTNNRVPHLPLRLLQQSLSHGLRTNQT